MKKICCIVIFFVLLTTNVSSQISADSVYTFVDKMPEFPGGQEKFMKYLALIDYPKCNIHIVNTRLHIEFTVSKTGEIYDAKILRSICKEIDNVILKSIESMPWWIPGIHNGKKVNVKIRLPIDLELQGTR